MVTDSPPQADTIVLIHGLWMAPCSWERWIERYVRRGYSVLAPAWPDLDPDADVLPGLPASFARSNVTAVIAHHERIIRALDRPPIIMGHAFGGVFVRLLLDRGLGCAGVALDAGRDGLARKRAVGPIPKRFRQTPKIRFEAGFRNAQPRPALRVESRRDGAAPLLFIAGGNEQIVLEEEGWQQVADYALNWASQNAIQAAHTPVLEHR